MQHTTARNQPTTALPPEDIVAEEVIIGSVLNDPEAIYRIDTALEASDFFHTAHQKIYEAFMHWHAQGYHPDLLTVASRLKDKGHLQEVGGEERLQELSERVMSSANVEAYAQMVFKKSKLRQMISCGAKLQHLGHQSDKGLDELLSDAEASVMAISDSKKSSGPKAISSFAEEAWDEILKGVENPGMLPGVTTGFYDLDELSQGMQSGDLIITAGRPASGKTAFVLSVAKNISEASGKHALIFSLEMSRAQLFNRMLSAEATIDSRRIKRGQLSPQELASLSAAKDKLKGLSLSIEESPSIKVSEICHHARKTAKKEGGLSVIMVDYLQIMGGADEDRVQALGKITRSLKALARELDCPVILLSQLSRSVESRTNKRPMMSDLRESGAIEQDADLILMLYREEYYDPDTPDRGIAEIIAVKNRNGPTGTVKLLFQPEFTKFVNRGTHEEYQRPVAKTSMRPTMGGQP